MYLDTYMIGMRCCSAMSYVSGHLQPLDPHHGRFKGTELEEHRHRTLCPRSRLGSGSRQVSVSPCSVVAFTYRELLHHALRLCDAVGLLLLLLQLSGTVECDSL